MALRVRNLQVDVPPDVHDAAVRWWAATLGGTPRATDEPEYTHLDDVRAPIGVHVQRLEDGPGGFHLDLETAGDVEAEVARLRALGAGDGGALPGGEAGRILVDPAGLPFCVTTAGQAQHLDDDRSTVHLQTLVVDVGAALVAAEVAFWAAALDGVVVPPHPDQPEFTAIRGAHGPGGGIGVLVQTIAQGPARVHVDLHVPDTATRDAEVARLVDLGATVTVRREWVVLTAPGGHPVCVVPSDV